MSTSTNISNLSESAKDACARRAAKRVGLFAHRSRWRLGTIDNHRRFMLTDPFNNRIVEGEKFDLSAEDVIALCAES
jgi:hypothetical protein